MQDKKVDQWIRLTVLVIYFWSTFQ